MPTVPTPDAKTLRQWEERGIVPPGTLASLRRGERRVIRPEVAPAEIVQPDANGNNCGPVAIVPVRLTVGPVPVKLVSEANAGGRLRDKLSRKKAVKDAVLAALEGLSPPPLPVVVVLTRVGAKEQDGDNNQRTLKSCRDTVAHWLGVDDRDRRVRWAYRQRAGWVSGVVIDVRTREG